ncbi:MAG: hypothetical protein KCHDKBKB_02360 [Elusimicrobia bacterium]|nr:hypothetical protein [Elusimicrobiota bacterium]
MSDIKETFGTVLLKKFMNPRFLAIGLFGVVFFVVVALSGQLFETVQAGNYAIKQAAVSGKMTAFTASGMFFQGFGDVFKYKAADILYFSKHEDEGREVDEAVEVRFNDGATATVTGNVRFELPNNPEQLIEIHRKFRSYGSLVKDTLKQVVGESVILTAALMSAEESYTTKRAEFSQMAYDQVKNGVYLTEADDIETKDTKTGETTKRQVVRIQRGEDKNPLRKESVLEQYGIRVTQFVIKEIDYQKEVHNTINSKQDALMKTVQAKAEAEKAQQDRLTAEEVGKKNVAVAKYEQEVEKAKAITAAEKELAVAELNKKAAEQYKLTQILKAEGDAEYRRKIMLADGALEKKLNAYIETQKAWADAMANMKQPVVPNVVSGGGSGGTGNSVVNMMELMGIKAARDLQLDLKPKPVAQ